MATDAAANTSQFDAYDRLAKEYQNCTVRCQQALDQLQACERNLGGSWAKEILSSSDASRL